MFCNNCGKEIPDGALFCTGCGKKIGDNAEQPVVQQPVIQQPITPQPAAQSNKKLIWVIIAIAAVFLIVAVIFGVLILGKLDDKDDDSDKKHRTKTEKTVDDEEIKETEEPEEMEAFPEVTGTENTDAEAEINETVAADDISAYLAERFPKLTEAYIEPKTDHSVWIPLDDEARAKLDALDNDYNKVSWIVEYAFRAMPSVIVSYAINENCGVPYVFVAFTNIGDTPVSIDGTAELYDFSSNLLASGYPYTGMLQSGGTYICPIACPGVDENNVDVGYKDLNMDYPAAKSGTYSSTATLGASTSNNITTSISVTNTGDQKENMGQVTVLLLDEHGLPVANGYVFSATSTNPGESMESDVQIGILDTDIDKIKDIAIFASPYITG